MAAGRKWTWTDAQEQEIKDLWDQTNNRQLAEHFGVGITAMRNKLREMGLKRMEMEYWTQEQVDYLKQHYTEIGDKELSEIFQEKWPKKHKTWTNKHIEKKRKYLKLKRTQEQIDQIHGRNVKAGRFSLCTVKRWNKIGRAEVGEIRTWKRENGHCFKVIKTKDGFVRYNRWLWRKLHGEIPEGMLVVTKNGDPLDITPGNLILITKKQHAERRPYRKLPPELQQAYQTTQEIINYLKDQDDE